MAGRKALLLLLLIVVAGTPSFGASDAEEKALLSLWSLQINTPAQHAALLKACQQVLQASPTNQLLPVSQGLAAWHSLHLGRTNEALALLKALAAAPTTSPTALAGVELSRRWLTRLDREAVRNALASYYARTLEYPANLPLLKNTPGGAETPLTDRWGAPWQYELAAFKIIKGTAGQRYRLQSKRLLEFSDLGLALARNYAGRISLKPISIATSSSGAQNVVFQGPGNPPEKIILSEGSQTGGITLSYIGAQILILSDGDHWLVLRKPGR